MVEDIWKLYWSLLILLHSWRLTQILHLIWFRILCCEKLSDWLQLRITFRNLFFLYYLFLALLTITENFLYLRFLTFFNFWTFLYWVLIVKDLYSFYRWLPWLLTMDFINSFFNQLRLLALYFVNVIYSIYTLCYIDFV